MSAYYKTLAHAEGARNSKWILDATGTWNVPPQQMAEYRQMRVE